MSLPNSYARYRNTQVETATQTKMIVMLYDGAIRFLQKAIPCMEAKDTYNQSLYLNKALAIVDHLWSSINLKDGGEIAKDLARIFPYLHQRVTTANVNDDQAAAQEVIGHLRSLRDAWAAVEEIKANSERKDVRNERGELCMAA